MTHLPGKTDRSPGYLGSKAGRVAIAFLAIAAFLLLSEHRAHALGFLPWLLLLACPLLHIFLHGGHGHHGRHGGHAGDGGGRAEGAPPEGG